MTLEHPLLLLALLSVPILYLLARNLRQRRAVPVASLLIWRRLGLDPDPPRDLARRADRLLLLRLLAAGLVAFGLAEPVLDRGAADPVVDVLIDSSPSMSACADNVATALDQVRDAAPPGAGLRITRAGIESALPALLARSGGGDVVIVTDHAPPGIDGQGRVRPVLVGAPVENVGITSAWLLAGRFGAVVESFAAGWSDVTVHHPGGAEALSLPPGASRVVEGPASGATVAITLRPGDPFPFDDRVVLAATPAVPVSLAWRGPEEPALRLALRSSGVTFDPAASSGLAYRITPEADTRMVVAPPGPRRAVEASSLIASGGLPAEACPPPGLPLGRATVLPQRGLVLLADRMGPLALLDGETVTLALDPADPESRWSRDPSFPVFMFELARRLGVREAGYEILEGVIDPSESATRPVSLDADLSGLLPGQSGGAAPGFGLAGILFALAGLLLLIHSLLERQDGGRSSASRPAVGSGRRGGVSSSP